MASLTDAAVRSGIGRLLEGPRYEVIPVAGIEDKLRSLPPGTRVTVTASPAHGQARTVDVAERLAVRGYDVVPHLSARMMGGRQDLIDFTARLGDAGINEAFVIGGDASPPAGPYADAGDLLDELAGLDHPFTTIGVGGYPEGHPVIPDDKLLEALLRKQAHADYVVTQLCFDAAALTGWMGTIREQGVKLPVVVGLPGVVERRKLAEISLKSGVGASLRYLRKHRREMIALTRARRYDPTPLLRSVAGRLHDDGLDASGVHLFTFNQVDATRAWVRSTSS